MRLTLHFLLTIVFALLLASTLNATTITSTGTGGLWNATTTWSGGVVPGTGNDVIIADGATVTINVSPNTLASLTIGQGTSGILTFDGVAARAVVVTGNVTVVAGGTFIVQSSGTFTNTLSIGGDLSNNGTFDMSKNSSSTICNVTFTKAGDQTITGTPTLTRFRIITLSKTALANRVVCSSNVSFAAAALWTTGTWEQTAGTLSCTSTNQSLASANGALIFSGSGGYSSTGSSLLVAGGALTINTSGTFVIGLLANSNNNLQITSGSLTIQKGTLNIYGYFKNAGGTTTISESGGSGTTNIIIKNLSGTNNSFDVPTAGTFAMSGGTITIVDPLSGSTGKYDVNMSTTNTIPTSITGGTIVIGDGSSTNTGVSGSFGFFINTHTVPLWNLTINAGTTAGRQVTLSDNNTPLPRDLVVRNNLTITSGTLNANVGTGSNITLGGTFTNSGTFNGSTTSRYTFNGTSAQVTNILPSTVGNLNLSNSAGITLSNPVIVSSTLTLAGCKVTLNANNLTAGSVSGGSTSSYVVSNGSGGLIQNVPGTSTNVSFPVGYTDTYTPVVLNNSGTADNFTVSVKDAFDNSPATSQVVNKQWTITEAGTGANVAITLQWNTADETGTYNGFIRTNPVYIGMYNSPIWQQTLASYTDLGGGVYTASAGGYTAFSSFAVGNVDALPVELSAFTSNVNGRDINLNWTTKTEKNSDKFEIERMVNLAWTNIGSIKASVLSNSPKQYSFTEKNLQAGKYQYRLKMIDNDGSFKYSQIVETEVSVPKNFDLSQNYPNPFNPSTKINYDLASDSKVTLEVYSITGERIAQLVNENQSAGFYSVNFMNKNISSGVYFYRINATNNATGSQFSSMKKMILVK